MKATLGLASYLATVKSQPSFIIQDLIQRASQQVGIPRDLMKREITIGKDNIPASMVFNVETFGILKGIRRIAVRTGPFRSAIMKVAV
jgi:hypothetical protein